MWFSKHVILECSTSKCQRDLAASYTHLATINWAINRPWTPGRAVWRIKGFDVWMTLEERNALWTRWGLGVGHKVDKRQAVRHLNTKQQLILVRVTSLYHGPSLTPTLRGHPAPSTLFPASRTQLHKLETQILGIITGVVCYNKGWPVDMPTPSKFVLKRLLY